MRKLQGRLCCEIPSVVAVSEDEQLQLRRMVLGDQIQNRDGLENPEFEECQVLRGIDCGGYAEPVRLVAGTA